MQEVLIFSTVIAPVILGLIEVVKQTVKFPKNYIPLLAVVVGLLVGYLAQPFTELDLVLRLWAGGLAGLSSTGLFETFKSNPGNTKN